MGKKSFFDNLIILVIIIVIFYIAILIFSDINAIADKISNIQITYLPIIFSLVGVQLVVLGIKYHRMLKKLGINIHHIPVKLS